MITLCNLNSVQNSARKIQITKSSWGGNIHHMLVLSWDENDVSKQVTCSSWMIQELDSSRSRQKWAQWRMRRTPSWHASELLLRWSCRRLVLVLAESKNHVSCTPRLALSAVSAHSARLTWWLPSSWLVHGGHATKLEIPFASHKVYNGWYVLQRTFISSLISWVISWAISVNLSLCKSWFCWRLQIIIEVIGTQELFKEVNDLMR